MGKRVNRDGPSRNGPKGLVSKIKGLPVGRQQPPPGSMLKKPPKGGKK